MLKVINGGFEPVRSTKYSACVDLFAREDVVIGAGETKIVPLGVKINLEKLNKLFLSNLLSNDATIDTDRLEDKFYRFMISHKLDLHIRSSLSAKKGLIIVNGTGQIDLDYPDEIGIILHNPMDNGSIINLARLIRQESEIEDYDKTVFIKKGDKVAQITLVEHKSYLVGYESEEERIGRYGSTGE